ncbi:cysteine dioxygenase family protein [Streptomyces sp. NPDC046557]|uniref:cysteine dioxygenase family protein n=1 Tax=Streptomyces sp. NPDC046557 TaxID=3155372 RepID=UPI0033EF1923
MTTTTPARTTTSMAALVSEIRAVVERGLVPDLTAHLVGERLAPYLHRDDLLTPEQREGHADRYRQHVLHAEPDGSFSVVALVWLPGQETAIHDHVAWCVSGVYEGAESELRYRLAPATATTGARLVVTEEVVNGPGDVCGFAPPGDIHKVRNSCRTTAISLHVYGADVVRLGSSVRRVYAIPAG